MADTLLMVARYEHDEKALENKNIDLQHTARACAEELQPIADSKKISIEINVPETRPLIRGDEQSLRRLFINLLDNAIKFSPDESKVRLSFELKPESIYTRIIDAGSGIPPEERAQLFQRFSRERSRRKGSGTGLGLYLCKRIAENHGGSLSYEMNGESSFLLVLPRFSGN